MSQMHVCEHAHMNRKAAAYAFLKIILASIFYLERGFEVSNFTDL